MYQSPQIDCYQAAYDLTSSQDRTSAGQDYA